MTDQVAPVLTDDEFVEPVEAWSLLSGIFLFCRRPTRISCSGAIEGEITRTRPHRPHSASSPFSSHLVHGQFADGARCERTRGFVLAEFVAVLAVRVGVVAVVFETTPIRTSAVGGRVGFVGSFVCLLLVFHRQEGALECGGTVCLPRLRALMILIEEPNCEGVDGNVVDLVGAGWCPAEVAETATSARAAPSGLAQAALLWGTN